MLEAEILTLRQQINVLRRTAPKKQTLSSIDQLIFVCLYRLLPGVRDALAIVKPERRQQQQHLTVMLRGFYQLCVPKTLSELMT
jgi:hypothetical protein